MLPVTFDQIFFFFFFLRMNWPLVTGAVSFSSHKMRYYKEKAAFFFLPQSVAGKASSFSPATLVNLISELAVISIAQLFIH